MKGKKIIKRRYWGASQIANCSVCYWSDETAREARNHCKETGHETSCERTDVVQYKLSPQE